MPTETALAIASLTFGGVLERLPNLRVCFAHGGGAFPSVFGRMGHGFDARPDLVAVDNPIHPAKYLGRFFVDSLTHDPFMLRRLIDLIGANRIALGSDYPFPLGEHAPGEMIDAMADLSGPVKEWLYYRSALEFLDRPATMFR
jgi:aminocarboxymuconate-semialdehyde decarboxylase